MHIDHVSIATSTLLTQLLIGLQSEGVLSEEAIDRIMRESVSLNGEYAEKPANLDAVKFLQEIWGAVRDSRS